MCMRYYALLRLARTFSRALRVKCLSFPKPTKGTTKTRSGKLEMENGEMEKLRKEFEYRPGAAVDTQNTNLATIVN